VAIRKKKPQDENVMSTSAMQDGRSNSNCIVNQKCIYCKCAVFKSLQQFRSVIQLQLQCGPVPNVMAALLNIGGALCSTPQSLADAHYWSAVQ